MQFEVTNYDSVPNRTSGRGVSTGMSEAIRSLEIGQSLHIPADGGPHARQRNRVGAIVSYCGGGSKYTVRMREDKSFDVYRIG